MPAGHLEIDADRVALRPCAVLEDDFPVAHDPVDLQLLMLTRGETLSRTQECMEMARRIVRGK
jgi:hypothetical protein